LKEKGTLYLLRLELAGFGQSPRFFVVLELSGFGRYNSESSDRLNTIPFESIAGEDTRLAKKK
jgi:hypothetical protein